MKQPNKIPRLFSNKVNTLLYLQGKLSASNILDLYFFSVKEYQENNEVIFENISTRFSGEIIIRSSASTEDQDSTNAGHFFSCQHIISQDKNAVFESIEKVIISYERDGLFDSELIFVQRQLADVILSGVALSYEPKFGKPYYMINFDDSGSTDSVTSGKCGQYMYIARDFAYQTDKIEARLCASLLEVEKYCYNNHLDIEFAITKEEKIYILQVRPLKTNISICNHDIALDVKNACKAKYSLKNILLSDMAYWNPSEIIGDAPHMLDYSLYYYLVTEHAWNEGIAQMGYFRTTEALMTKIGNKPYINLETAFRALTPSSIDEKLREKIVKHYCQVLLKNKSAHDKIEFEIAFTCFDFCTDKKLSALHDFGFKDDEITALSTSLYQTTKSIIEQYDEILKTDSEKLEFLKSEFNWCKSQIEDSVEKILASIAYLLPIIRDYGVIPFARQARCAFIAHSIALSLAEIGQISPKQLEVLMGSVRTIASELKVDVSKYKKSLLTEAEMICKYGHLRTNTYNISSPTYKEMGFDKIFDFEDYIEKEDDKTPEYINQNLLFPGTQTELIPFIKSAIAQREYFKFVYTQALSYVLESIAKLAQRFNLSQEEISFLSIEDILNISSSDARKKLIKTINANKKVFELYSYIILPPVISESNDFDIIKISEGAPNFITCKTIVGEICVFDKLPNEKPNVSGKIVVLQNADPGFDWIFAQGSIIGLITQYGGMASHMAIRCMEFGIPAAIGCGELIYNYVVKAKRIKLDCLAKKVVKV